MATTGELREIIEELELVDIGEAASYLGDAANMVDASSVWLSLDGIDGSELFMLFNTTVHPTEED